MTLPSNDPVVTPPASGAHNPPTEPTPPAISGANNPPPPARDWEASYKGLQSSSDKKIQDLTIINETLQQKYVALNTEHEALKKQFADISTNKTVLETSETALREQLKTAITEKDRYATTLRQQTLILRDYPQLAQFTAFIPSADTDEAYIANAKAFAETLKSYVDVGVKSVVSGGTPPAPPVTTPPPNSASQEDIIWDKVSRLAGVPGKEAEFETAMEEWTNFKNKR